MLPPYNEHLVRDYGFMNLGMTVIFVVAAVRLTPVLVRTAAAALFVFGLPHTLFHSAHLDHMSTGDAATLIVTTSVLTVVLPAVVFWMAGGLHRPGLVSRPGPASRETPGIGPRT
jgi:low temperature requirement protein LtrA